MRNEISLQYTMAFVGKSSKQIKVLREKSIYLIASVSPWTSCLHAIYQSKDKCEMEILFLQGMKKNVWCNIERHFMAKSQYRFWQILEKM